MTTPSSGAIAISNINTEIAFPTTANSSLNQSSFRNLVGIPSGAISLSNFYNRTNLLWADTGSTYHPNIAVYGTTYTSDSPTCGIDNGGGFYVNVPTDQGGSSFYTTTLVNYGPANGYTIRLYNADGYIQDPNGNSVPIGSWSAYFYITTTRNFYLGNYTSGTAEIQNQYSGAAIYTNWYVNVYYL